MSENSNVKMTAGVAAGAVIFGIMLSEIASDALEGQPYWLRIAVRAISAGAVTVIFVLVASRLSRK